MKIYQPQIDEENLPQDKVFETQKKQKSQVTFQFEYVEKEDSPDKRVALDEDPQNQELGINSQPSSKEPSPFSKSLSVIDTVENYQRLQNAINKYSSYFRLSQKQYISLRRGSSWKHMVLKVIISLFVFAVFPFLPAESDEQKINNRWLHALFGLIALYFLITSSLYLVQFPISEFVHESSVYMTFILERLLFAFLTIASVHLYHGFLIEMYPPMQEDSSFEAESYRAARILATLFLIVSVIYLAFALVSICALGGLDGSRVLKAEVYRSFSVIPYGALIFKEGLDCGLCMERFKNEQRVVQLSCYESHIFHRNCLMDRNDRCKTKCPYCFVEIK